MRIFLLLTVLFCFDLMPAFAQHEADNWYFGENAGMSFKNGTRTVLSDSKLFTSEGCASISDNTTGALLFYTDGVTVWNRKHQIMKNGTNLKGGFSSTQSALIVPNPANKTQYYVFTAPTLTISTSVNYSIVSLENSDGEVLSKNNLLIDNMSEKLTATIDCEGIGFWVVTHHGYNNIFYSFHITNTGISSLPIQSNYNGNSIDNGIGYLRISPNGQTICMANFAGDLKLFSFNLVTGVVSQPMVLEYGGGTYYGIAFSPDNTKLYALAAQNISDAVLYQYETISTDVNKIKNSREEIFRNLSDGAIALAPDGKIYLNNYQLFALSVINKPNMKGTACEFNPRSVVLSAACNFGLPNIMDYIFNQGRTVEQTFTLQPETVIITPGMQFNSILNIKGSQTQWSVKLHYDPLVVKFKSISEGQGIPDNLRGELLIKGSGGNKSISIYFDAFLPHTSDTMFPIRLETDASQVTACGKSSGIGNILMLSDYCARNIRMVSSTGKKYYLTVKDKSIDFGVGLSGNVRVEVFDYVGKSVLVVSDGNLEAGEYSTALDLPVGVYYCRMSAGMYQNAGKVMIVR